jgi:REP element-mobilizing transposase RayT
MQPDNYRRYSIAEAVPTVKLLQHPTQPNVFFPVHRRPTRLAGIDYASADIQFFVTYNVRKDCEVRFLGDTGKTTWDTMLDEMDRLGCRIYAACLMPNHAHVLLSPSGSGENVSTIVGRTKSRCCQALRLVHNCYLHWQPSFYDHVLRDREQPEREIQTIAHYIRNNPVRAGLGDNYPFCR